MRESPLAENVKLLVELLLFASRVTEPAEPPPLSETEGLELSPALNRITVPAAIPAAGAVYWTKPSVARKYNDAAPLTPVIPPSVI